MNPDPKHLNHITQTLDLMVPSLNLVCRGVLLEVRYRYTAQQLLQQVRAVDVRWCWFPRDLTESAVQHMLYVLKLVLQIQEVKDVRDVKRVQEGLQV